MSHFQAVIFDMDGLMLDTERIALACWDQAARMHGYELDPAIGLGMVGLNTRDCVRWVKSVLGEDFPMEQINVTSRELYHAELDRDTPLKPGLLPLLQWLEQQQIPRAVATSTRHEWALKKLRKANILDYFQGMVCGDQVSQGKPHPEIFLAAASRINMEPAACVVLEDSDPGVRGAHAAGMRVIQVPDVKAPSAEVLAFGHPVYPSLHEAHARLQLWQGLPR
ncbi:MAG: HAD family phosphatase [Chitinivorax sp.]